MEKSFTQQDIEKFLSDFRNLTNPYKMEKVHQLLNNPYAKAKNAVKLNYNPFNFIIMTSAFILGLSALLIWSNPKKADIDEIRTFKKSEVVKEVVLDSNFSSRRTTDLNQPKVENPIIKSTIAPKSEALTKIAMDSDFSAIKTTDLN
jgi:hypothetical protein